MFFLLLFLFEFVGVMPQCSVRLAQDTDQGAHFYKHVSGRSYDARISHVLFSIYDNKTFASESVIISFKTSFVIVTHIECREIVMEPAA